MAILFVILVLLVFKVDYVDYNNGAKYLSYLLNATTFCLAIPLYQQIELFKDNSLAIVVGVLSGVFASL